MIGSRIVTASVVATVLAVTPAMAASLSVTDDASVNLASSGQNLGSTPSLFVRNTGSGGTRYAFTRFDLSALPASSSVDRAVLRLFVNRVDAAGDLDVFVVTSAWNEDTLTASSQPSLEATPVETVAVGTGDQAGFVLVDVTDAVNDWLSGAKTNYGLALLPATAGTLRIEVDSKEDTSTGHVAELEVFRTAAAEAPATIYLRDEEVTTSERTSVSVECDEGDRAVSWGFSTLSGEVSNLVQAYILPDFAGYSFIIGEDGMAATFQVVCQDLTP